MMGAQQQRLHRRQIHHHRRALILNLPFGLRLLRSIHHLPIAEF
jgi:hypothetical protein